MILDSRKLAILMRESPSASIEGVDLGDASASEPAICGMRRHIWQIAPSMHCSILGTCLTINDLTTMARRVGARLDSATSPYHLHSVFVDCMPRQNEVSRLVDKALEKRHGGVAKVVRRAKTEEELEAKWKELAGRGHIASAYWGAMSHPLCSTDLQWRLFGEIHMLSHLVGASRRSDLCRLQELEVSFATLEDELMGLKRQYRATLADQSRQEAELDLRRRELALSERRLQSAEQRIAALDAKTFASESEARIEALERQLGAAVARASRAESALVDSATTCDRATATANAAAEQVRELLADNGALEAELTAALLGSRLVEAAQTDIPLSLAGMRILCVGGMKGLVQHYRQLVERRGGELLHHDGGLEDSLDAVTRALATVDVVLCPVDSVSHAASLKVKRACKHLGKPFVPLRSSGLSSFARSLQALRAPALLLTLLALGCSDGGAATPTGGDGVEPVYAVMSQVFDAEGDRLVYVGLTKSLDMDGISLDGAHEYSGVANMAAMGGRLYVSDGEDPMITRYAITDDLTWVETGRIGFQGYPLSDNANFFGQFQVDDSTMYLTFDVSSRIVWDPTKLEVKDVLEESSLAATSGNLTLSAAGNHSRLRYGGNTLQAFFYHDEDWYDFGTTSLIAVYDRETHEEIDVLEGPCPGLSVNSMDEQGRTYFSAWDYTPLLALYGAGPAPCVARVTEDGALDTAFETDLTSLTGGRYLMNFRYVRDGWGFADVLHHELLDADFEGEVDPAVLDQIWDGGPFQLWRIDLENRTAEPFEGVGDTGMGWRTENVDGRTSLHPLPGLDLDDGLRARRRRSRNEALRGAGRRELDKDPLRRAGAPPTGLSAA